MTTDLYARAKVLFQQASALPPAERAVFLARATAGDEALRREVESWLAASERAGSFLEGSAKLCSACKSSFEGSTRFCPHCGQPVEDDPRALVGCRLDNLYLVEELIGRGGMGAVYRARHLLLGDVVAIKTLRCELSDNPLFLRRFQREGRAARAFRHPNAVTVYDLRATATGLVYMVLEYIDGRTLRQELRARGPFTVAEALEVLEPIASALDAAHAGGVVHRDLKPENVMVSRSGAGASVVKVLDLGIAKLIEGAAEPSQTNLTLAGQFVGTPHYMSPEQWGEVPRDGETEIDGRADVYSLGVIAYELMTGRWPYTAESLQELRRAHIVHVAPTAHEVVPSISPEISGAIARALAKDRGDRTPTAGAFVEELRRAAASYAVGGAHATPAPGGTEDESTVPLEDVTAPPALPPPARPIADAPSSHARDGERAPNGGRGRIAGRRAAAVAAALMLVATTGVAAYLWRASSEAAAGVASASLPPEPVAAPAAPAAPLPVLDYSIELAGPEPARSVTGLSPIAAGTRYRLRFIPTEPGYLYVVGPNTRNVPTLFLATPAGTPVAAGSAAYFPTNGMIRPGRDVLEDRATVIFSKEPLPASFAGGTAGRALTLEEQIELDALERQYGGATVATEAVETPDGPCVAVRASAPSGLVVFDIAIRYSPVKENR